MDNYDEFPDLKMTALAILYQTKWRCPSANMPNDFVVKQALVTFSSRLQDDDIGYFYDPDMPRDFCTNPGELVGKIANSHLPYNFNFRNGIIDFVKMLDIIDENEYDKTAIVIADCLSRSEAEDVVSILSDLKNVKCHVFGIGGCAVVGDMTHLQDALELEKALESIAN